MSATHVCYMHMCMHQLVCVTRRQDCLGHQVVVYNGPVLRMSDLLEVQTNHVTLGQTDVGYNGLTHKQDGAIFIQHQ